MKMISYWCEYCGSKSCYPDCGGFDVHLPCPYCGILTRHTNDKYGVVCRLESHLVALSISLGRLVGLETMEEMADEKTLLAAIEQ